jgi:hypothetical protein
MGPCSPYGVPPHPLFNPFVGTPFRLTASQGFAAGRHVLPQTPSLIAPGAPPFPLAPYASQLRRLRQALTRVLGDGFQPACRSKDLRAFGLRAHPLTPRPTAQNSKTLAGCGLRAGGHCRQVCRRSPATLRRVYWSAVFRRGREEHRHLGAVKK